MGRPGNFGKCEVEAGHDQCPHEGHQDTPSREAAEEVGFIQRVREHIRAARDAAAEIGAPFSIPLRLGRRGRSLSVI